MNDDIEEDSATIRERPGWALAHAREIRESLIANGIIRPGNGDPHAHFERSLAAKRCLTLEGWR